MKRYLLLLLSICAVSGLDSTVLGAQIVRVEGIPAREQGELIIFRTLVRPFLNEGIRPDVEIVPEADDFMTGYDRGLQSALETLLT